MNHFASLEFNFISQNQINLLHIQHTIDNKTHYDWLAKNDPHACSWSASCCTLETSDAISCIDLFWCWAYASSVWYKDDCTWVSWNYVLSHWLLILNLNLLKKCMCQIVKSLSLGQGRFQGGGTGPFSPPPIGKHLPRTKLVLETVTILWDQRCPGMTVGE